MLWLFFVMAMIGTGLVHVCEGMVKCPVVARYGLFTGVGEWVVNSGKMGQSPR